MHKGKSEKVNYLFQITHVALSLSTNDYNHSSSKKNKNKTCFDFANWNQNHPKHLFRHCPLKDRQNLSQGRTLPLLLDHHITFRVCLRSCGMRCRRNRMLINFAGGDRIFIFRKVRSSFTRFMAMQFRLIKWWSLVSHLVFTKLRSYCKTVWHCFLKRPIAVFIPNFWAETQINAVGWAMFFNEWL